MRRLVEWVKYILLGPLCSVCGERITDDQLTALAMGRRVHRFCHATETQPELLT